MSAIKLEKAIMKVSLRTGFVGDAYLLTLGAKTAHTIKCLRCKKAQKQLAVSTRSLYVPQTNIKLNPISFDMKVEDSFFVLFISEMFVAVVTLILFLFLELSTILISISLFFIFSSIIWLLSLLTWLSISLPTFWLLIKLSS